MDAARQDLVDLAPSYPRAHSSIREVLESGSIESILSGDTESVTTKTRFDFDSLLLNTRTYRAAYQRRPLRHYHRVTGVAIKTPYREEEVDLIDLATVTKVPVPAMPVSRFAVDLEELGLRGNDTATRDIGCELYPGLHTHNKPIVHGIQSKDVVALMNHLTVRDAQRNARDTEILVDLTRSAADMRSAFGDVRKFLAETDDLLLSNTEGSGGSGELASRPLAQSAVSDGTRHLQYKKKSLFRRAMKGLSLKGGNDQAVIEEMLVNLLTQTEELRQQTGQDGTTTAGMLSGYRDQKLSREGITTPVSDRGLQCSPEHATGGECALSQFPDDLQKAFRVPRKSLTPSITP
ncbi:hypothetical protein GGR57DRAFT_288242 [Xylariaceae sp. FL1272]|nr:hypothetical protein GGR57DRAFT_288242 [Xylariaceae sp. FL1272]